MKKIAILLFTIAALGAGCKKFTDINNNPNQPLAVTPSALLSAALAGSATDLSTDFLATTRWMGYWARSGNFITTPTIEDYQLDVSANNSDWQRLYSTLNRYNSVEIAGKANPTQLAFYIGVAKTMKALHFSTLVDAFNNVPYSQAFNLGKFPTPKYDDAAAIYADLITQLDSAVFYFNTAKASYTSGGITSTQTAIDDQYDIVFGRGTGGSDKAASATRMVKWIQFANTVKLKILLTEQGLIGGAAVTSELAKTTGGYLTAGTNAAVNPGYSNSSTSRLNPFYNNFLSVSGAASNGISFLRASQYGINFYKNTNDPARGNLAYGQSGSALVGNYDGDPNSLTNSVTATIGPGVLKGPSQDQLIISDFESLFMQAEAVQEGYITGDKAALVKSAVEQSFIYLGDTAADADNYLTSNAGNPLVDPATGLRAIMTQKWISLNGINWEQAYTDYRRTGLPIPDGVNFGLTHAPTPDTHNGKVALPYRYLYPQSEVNTNSKNIPQGTNAYTPVFWDKREQ